MSLGRESPVDPPSDSVNRVTTIAEFAVPRHRTGGLLKQVPVILLPYRVMYRPGPGARTVIDRIEPLHPIYAADVRLEGDTIVIVEGERDVQRWGRDRHWCAFPGSCPTCA